MKRILIIAAVFGMLLGAYIGKASGEPGDFPEYFVGKEILTKDEEGNHYKGIVSYISEDGMEMTISVYELVKENQASQDVLGILKEIRNILKPEK